MPSIARHAIIARFDRDPTRQRAPSKALLTALLAALALGGTAQLGAATDADALEQRVAQLQAQLEQAKRDLAAAKTEASEAKQKTAQVEAELASGRQSAGRQDQDRPSHRRRCHPRQLHPRRLSQRRRRPVARRQRRQLRARHLSHQPRPQVQTARRQAEYRWYDGYNFLHTGWLGWDFDNGSQVQVGVNRVPFGPGPYGVSQSWFFDQHYYVGLADDMDLGIKYVTSLGNWDLDFAYYNRSEWNGNGTSQDSARYSYDAVVWDSALEPNGDVVAALPNGFEERNQFNVRAIYGFDDIAIPTKLGLSLQWGQLKGRRADDGDHWAASLHMTNSWNNWLLASQITRYKWNIDNDNLLGTDELLPMGAYDFAWPAATDAWIPAVSLSYLYETNQIPWLDSVRPYVEYSNIVKVDKDFNDSQLVTVGAAWARQGWYIYTDLAFSTATTSSATRATTTATSSTVSATSASTATTSGTTASTSTSATTSEPNSARRHRCRGISDRSEFRGRQEKSGPLVDALRPISEQGPPYGNDVVVGWIRRVEPMPRHEDGGRTRRIHQHSHGIRPRLELLTSTRVV
jgi:outer membrane murein-binding lipoprotein Lpp